MDAHPSVMDTPTSTPDPVTPGTSEASATSDPSAGSFAAWRARIDAAVSNRKTYLDDWRTNVSYRVMQVFQGSEGDASVDRVALPEDWARTKQKQSQLSFQLPKIVASHSRPEALPFAPHVTAAVNQVLTKTCKAHYMIDECLADAINATGVLASKIRIDIITEEVEIQDPSQPPPVEGVPSVPRMIKTTRTVARRLGWDRLSTSALLWPAEFASSHWDQAPWLGHDQLVPCAVVKKHPVWGPIVAAAVEGGKETPVEHEGAPENLSKDITSASRGKLGTVPCYRLQEIWYRAAQFDTDARHPDHLRTLVFIEGLTEPVQSGDADEQTWVPATPDVPPMPAGVNPMTGQPTPAVPGVEGKPGHFTGLVEFPIRVETLTYVSDVAIPPSDSRAGRAQVNELMRSRAQMLKQRDTSIPIRWYDVNRVDETIVEEIRKGNWQDMIPMNGPGDRAIGEVARANYPRENFQFQAVLGRDLDGAWSLSNNQLGSPNSGERSATEISAVQNAASIRLSYEKGKVNRYVAEGSAVLWSLMQRYTTGPEYVEILGQNGAKILAAMPKDAYAQHYEFDFVPDTSDHIDLETKQERFTKTYNLMRKSPNAIGAAMDAEMVRLHGYDPAQFIKEAPPPAPEPPNVSFRFSGEDLSSPIALALALKSYPLTPADIATSAMMIKDALARQIAMPPQEVMDGTHVAPGAEGAPPLTKDPNAIEPPETVEPILKRSVTGEHF